MILHVRSAIIGTNPVLEPLETECVFGTLPLPLANVWDITRYYQRSVVPFVRCHGVSLTHAVACHWCVTHTSTAHSWNQGFLRPGNSWSFFKFGPQGDRGGGLPGQCGSLWRRSCGHFWPGFWCKRSKKNLNPNLPPQKVGTPDPPRGDRYLKQRVFVPNTLRT